MDPITLIVTALAAGASAGVMDGLKGNAREAAGAAYARLRRLAGKRVAGDRGAELALTEHEADPENWETPLKAKLIRVNAADDSELVAAANALMELLDRAGARSGKYNVTVSGGQGVQIGEGNVQNNVFNR